MESPFATGLLLTVAYASTVGGLATPVGTPPNAVVYGSGKIPITSMIRAGTALHLLGLAWLLGGLWLLAQMGVLPADLL